MLDHKAKLEVLSNGVVPVFPARQGKAISENVLLFLPTPELKERISKQYGLHQVDAIGMVGS